MGDSDREEKRRDDVAVDENESFESDTAAEKRLVRKTDLLMMPGLGLLRALNSLRNTYY